MKARHPSISVVVASGADPTRLSTTVESLAGQTLRPDAFEVLAIGELQYIPEHPTVQVRRLGIAGADRTTIRTAGMAMARGVYVTFIAAGDTVSPTYLESLLALAEPDVLGFAHVADQRGAGLPGFDLGEDSALARSLRGMSSPDGVAVALSSVAGVILPTVLGRAVRRVDSESRFLSLLITQFDCAVAFCPTRANAVYFREPQAPPGHDADLVGIDVDLDAVELLTNQSVPARHEPMVRAAIAASVESINRTLLRSPDLHARVLEDIRARDIRSFDYPRLNRGLAHDLAILYAALPFSDTSANIAARRVRAAGLLVDVVCADLSRQTEIDHSATAIWVEYVDRQCRLPGKVSLHGEWGTTAEFCRRGLVTIEDWERAKGPYRSIYSRTMFPASHLLAAAYKIRHPETRWLAEFSDPQLRDSRGGIRQSKGAADTALLAELAEGIRARGFTAPSSDNVWEWAETATYLLADSVLFTNDSQRAYMLRYCSDRTAADRAFAVSQVVHHPAPPAHLYHAVELAYELDPSRTHVGYFGTFYPTRSLTEVISALKTLDPVARDRLRLHVFTKKPDQLRKEVARMGLADVLVVNGYLAFDEYLNLTTRLDVLLVNDYRTEGLHERNPYLPAKYSDYLGSGSEIWGIVEPGSVLSALRLDHQSELGDVDGARRVLKRLVSAEPARSGAGRPWPKL